MDRIIRREVRRRRRGHGLFSAALVIVVLIGAADVVTLQSKISDLKKGQPGLSQLAIGVAGQNRVMETLTFWGAIAAVLAVLVLATRGDKLIIEEREERDEAAGNPPPNHTERQMVRR